MYIFIEIGRKYFWVGFQNRLEGEQGRQPVGDSDDQGATLPSDQKLRNKVGITKAHSLVHPGPEERVAVASGDASVV